MQLFCLELHLEAAQLDTYKLAGHSWRGENSLCLHFFWLHKCCADSHSLQVAALFWLGVKMWRDWLILLVMWLWVWLPTGISTVNGYPGGSFILTYSQRLFQPKWKVVNGSEGDHTHSCCVHLQFTRIGATQPPGLLSFFYTSRQKASSFWLQSWNFDSILLPYPEEAFSHLPWKPNTGLLLETGDLVGINMIIHRVWECGIYAW